MAKNSDEMISLCLMKDAPPDIQEAQKELDELCDRLTQQRDFLMKQARDIGVSALKERNAIWDRIYAALKARFGDQLPSDWSRNNYGMSLSHGVIRYREDRASKDGHGGLPEEISNDVMDAIMKAFQGLGKSRDEIRIVKIQNDGEKPN